MFTLNPVKFAVTDTSLVPDPMDCDAVVLYVDKVLLVPHSKYAVLKAPLGLTVPFRVADVELILLAAFVVTIGAIPLVVKLTIDPRVIPALFCPTTR